MELKCVFDFHVPFPSLYLVFQATMGHRQRLPIGVEGRRAGSIVWVPAYDVQGYNAAKKSSFLVVSF